MGWYVRIEVSRIPSYGLERYLMFVFKFVGFIENTRKQVYCFRLTTKFLSIILGCMVSKCERFCCQLPSVNFTFFQLISIFSVIPCDQHLSLMDGTPLVEDSLSLADLSIHPGSILLLRVWTQHSFQFIIFLCQITILIKLIF